MTTFIPYFDFHFQQSVSFVQIRLMLASSLSGYKNCVGVHYHGSTEDIQALLRYYFSELIEDEFILLNHKVVIAVIQHKNAVNEPYDDQSQRAYR